jgi:hypothetical protein
MQLLRNNIMWLPVLDNLELMPCFMSSEEDGKRSLEEMVRLHGGDGLESGLETQLVSDTVRGQSNREGEKFE